MKQCWKFGTLALTFTVSALAQTLQQAPAGKLALDVLPRVSVTVLVENMAGSAPVLGEWGIAFLIKTDQHQILFDTGGGRTLLENAHALEVDLGRTEAIVISHEHADHTGGLESALNATGSVDLFVHPAGFETRYWKHHASPMAHSLPLSRQPLSQRVRKLIETKEPTRIREGLMVTGQIPRVRG